MQGASRASLSALREGFPAAGDQQELSEQLFAVVSLLTAQGSLRRVLTDPAVEPEDKQRVVTDLLSSQLGEQSMRVLRDAVAARWSQGRDLLDALEELAVDAALAVADDAGQLDEVEDQLFRFERIVDSEPDLRAALTDRNLPADRKRDLLHRLLDGKVTDVTLNLVERAVLTPRGRTIERVIDDLSRLAAQRRERLIARVSSAVALSDEEERDLAAALARSFGHDVRLQVVVDPSLVGGLTVRVGDELIDGSVSRHLDEARRRLTGRTGPRRT